MIGEPSNAQKQQDDGMVSTIEVKVEEAQLALEDQDDTNNDGTLEELIYYNQVTGNYAQNET